MNKFIQIALLSLLVQSSSFAWGPIGHRVVGQVAEYHLTPKAKLEVKKILSVESLAQVSTWADYIKSDRKWRKASPWHYVSIDDGKTYESSTKNPKGDIVEAIARYTKILKDKKVKLKDRAIALKFLVHFYGDIHQPLHVGHKHDRGGNSVKLKWFGKSTNLHSIWDVDLIEMQKLSYIEYTDFINHASKKEIEKWQSDDIKIWIKESMALRPQVYDIVKNSKDYGKYGEYKYNYKNIKTLNQRMLQAGVRLAGLLNNIL
jgi:hypothetical protein